MINLLLKWCKRVFYWTFTCCLCDCINQDYGSVPFPPLSFPYVPYRVGWGVPFLLKLQGLGPFYPFKLPLRGWLQVEGTREGPSRCKRVMTGWGQMSRSLTDGSGSCRFPKGTLLRSWLTKSRPRLLLLIAGLKRPQVTLMRRKRMKRTKVAKAT